MAKAIRAAFMVGLLWQGGAALAQEAVAPLPNTPAVVISEAPSAPPAPAAPSAPVVPEAAAAPVTPAVPATPEGAAVAPVAVPVAPGATAVEPNATGLAEATPALEEGGRPRGGHGRGHGGPRGEGFDAPPAPAHGAGHSVELGSLFWDAHWIVKAVMIGLVIAAFAALVILIHKLIDFAISLGKLRYVGRVLAKSETVPAALTALSGRKGPAVDVVRVAAEELRLAEAERALIPGVAERSQHAMARIEAGAAARLRSGTGILASIGSLSPFVGLFGTVFGIMNSFLAIAASNTTNLAVVAPGIAEALLATAIGLAAAIPAVLIYNICTRRLAKYRQQLGDIVAATLRLQSRAIDRLNAEA